MFELHIDALLLGFYKLLLYVVKVVLVAAMVFVCAEMCIYMSVCHYAFVDFFRQTCLFPADSSVEVLSFKGCVLGDPGKSQLLHYLSVHQLNHKTLRYAESVLSNGIRSAWTAQSNYITSESFGVAVSAQN